MILNADWDCPCIKLLCCRYHFLFFYWNNLCWKCNQISGFVPFPMWHSNTSLALSMYFSPNKDAHLCWDLVRQQTILSRRKINFQLVKRFHFVSISTLSLFLLVQSQYINCQIYQLYIEEQYWEMLMERKHPDNFLWWFVVDLWLLIKSPCKELILNLNFLCLKQFWNYFIATIVTEINRCF